MMAWCIVSIEVQNRESRNMSKKRIEGSFVAMVTPFDEKGDIDFGAWRALINHQHSHGTRAILFLGSTGEPSLLSPEEKKRVIIETVKLRPKGMVFFYGCTGASPDQVIETVRFAAANGADGAVIAAPPYICASETDIEQFYLEIADAVDLPLGIYNNPPRVKTDLQAAQLLRLFRHPNIVIHKESTQRVGQVAQLLAASPDVSVMCCDSPNLGLVVPTMALGGHGTANMGGNIAPAEMARISEPWVGDGNAIAFREAYLQLLPLLHFNYSAINPVAVKSLMRACGLPVGALRKPLRELEPEAIAQGLRIVRELELDSRYGFPM
jgi:4-hydroxy-tetrahydrodipicolinate synthase